MMDYKRAATKNVAWVTFGQIGTRVLGMGFFLYLAYALGDTAVGTFSFGFAFLGLWFALGELGLFQYLTRRWSQDTSDWEAEYSNAIGLKTLTSGIILAGLAVYLLFFDQELWVELLLVFVALFLDQIRAVQEIYFNSQNRFGPASIALIIERGAEAILGSALLFLGFGLQPILLVYILGRVIAIAYQRSQHPFPRFFKLERGRAIALTRAGFPFLLIGVFTVIYFRIDMIMLRYLQDLTTVGWYSAAYRFIDLLGILPGIFATATMPLFVRAFRDNDTAITIGLFRKIFTYSLVIGTAVLTIGSMVAPGIIGFFYTSEFAPASYALQILLLASFLIFIDYLYLMILTVQHREKTALKVMAASAVINVGLNFLLIPRFSLYGSAWATVITEAFVLVVVLYLVRMWPDLRQVLKIGASAALAVLGMVLLQDVHFIIQAGVGLAVYGIALLGLGVITSKDLAWRAGIAAGTPVSKD